MNAISGIRIGPHESLTVLIRERFCCIVSRNDIRLIVERCAEARMIEGARLLAEFEENELRKEKPDYASALRIFEAMWKEGNAPGGFASEIPA